jgi:Spy/CpxP family protein refolding chaperone
MSKRGLSRLATLVALTLVGFVAPLAASPAGAANFDPDSILRNPRALARYLRLTPAQITTYRQLLGELEAKLVPLRAARRDLYQDLAAALEATSPDACAIGAIQIDIHDLGEQMRQAWEEFDTAFSAILTPQQLARYEALKDAARHFFEGD